MNYEELLLRTMRYDTDGLGSYFTWLQHQPVVENRGSSLLHKDDEEKIEPTPAPRNGLKPILTKEAFGTLGVEPTFCTNAKIPAALNQDDGQERWNDWWDHLNQFLLGEIRNDLSDANLSERVKEWIEDFQENSDGEIEIPNPEPYDFAEDMFDDYKKMVAHLKRYGVVPMTQNCLETEGGCHINVGYNKLQDKIAKEKLGKNFLGRFKKNLRCFYNHYPSLAWINCTPNDTISCCILTDYNRKTEKGDCVNFRSNYVEMRAFMMPRSNREFVFQLEFCNNIVWKVYEMTKAGTDLRLVNTKKSIRNYTYTQALEECKRVMKFIGSSYREAVDLGKVDMMKERFERANAKNKHKEYLT